MFSQPQPTTLALQYDHALPLFKLPPWIQIYETILDILAGGADESADDVPNIENSNDHYTNNNPLADSELYEVDYVDEDDYHTYFFLPASFGDYHFRSEFVKFTPKSSHFKCGPNCD